MSEGRYDRSITLFSPDGRLIQVEYAEEAIRRCSAAVGVRGKDSVVLAVEKRTIPELQVERTVRKILPLDGHIALAFAGLTADARVLINRARFECQSYRLTLEAPATVRHVSKFIGELKLKYTLSNGRRPFGVSCIVGGFDPDGTPRLFQTQPSGVFAEWKSAATGRRDPAVRGFLEATGDHGNEDADGAVRAAIGALKQILQPTSKNIEVALLRKEAPMIFLDPEELMRYISQVE